MDMMRATTEAIKAKALEEAADELNQADGIVIPGLTEESQVAVIRWLYERAIHVGAVDGFIGLAKLPN
jgi:hypothetical protein